MLLDAIIENSVKLICNPFGNYVIQVFVFYINVISSI